MLQTDLKVVPPQIPERNAPKAMSVLAGTGVESIGNEIFDSDCLKLMNEYFYGVRIFPGQDPTHVYVGWVTSQYHLHTKDFNLSKVRKASIVIVDDYVDQWVNWKLSFSYLGERSRLFISEQLNNYLVILS